MVLGTYYQQFLCLSLEEILMISMNILFEDFFLLKIEEPFGIVFGHLWRAKWHARAISSLSRSPAQFTNPRSGKGFTNVFAYEQHRNDAIRAGTLCASHGLTMRDELTGVRRVDRPVVPVLHARPLPGLDGANNAKRMWMRKLLCQRTERWACCCLQFRWT